MTFNYLFIYLFRLLNITLGRLKRLMLIPRIIKHGLTQAYNT